MFRIIFGVILPIACLGVEYFCRFCTTAFFDPIPTWFHVAMITFVAYANGWLVFSFANPDYKPLKRDALAIGIGIGISLIYALRFIPLMPAGAMCLIIWGLGLLVFGPAISFFVGVSLARKLSKGAVPGISRNVFIGTCIGVMCVCLAELPHTLTRHALIRALSSNPLEARRGINSLLLFGSQDELLKFCYSDKAQMSDLANMALSRYDCIDPIRVRKIFYRITGVPFNREKFPQEFLSKGDDFFFTRWDRDLAGEEVGGRVDNLSLKNSHLDITCDPNSASADLDWTFVFENMSDVQAEARTNIALPPGAVVSDLTLWINGVEQPAAFGSKSKTRAAYQSVVSRSRDPVLVTSAGGDRVLLQCFPVPVKGTMKTRIRIAAPLAIESDKATLVLPKLIENNFDILNYMKTTVKSTTPVEKKPHSLIAANTAGVYSLKGVIDQNKFDSTVEPIVFQRNPNAPAATKVFTANKTTNLLTQQIKVVHDDPTENVVIVVDASKAMRPYTNEVSEALASISDRLPWSIVLASDEISALTPEDSLYKQLTPKVVANGLKNLKFQGGPDNASALVTAAQIAARKADIKILWIHSPQPVIADDFMPNFDHEKWARPTVYSFEVEAGPNVVAEKLSNELTFKTVPRFGTVKDDLNKVIKQLDSGADEFRPIRTVAPIQQSGTQAVRDTTHDELIKLWAYDQVLTGLRKNDHDGATRTATTYRIVTPVSGAVVLETQQDFKNAGLTQKQDPTKSHKGANGEPVFQDEAEVPSVPEPEMWLMLFLVGVILLLQKHRFLSMLPLSVQSKLPWRN